MSALCAILRREPCLEDGKIKKRAPSESSQAAPSRKDDAAPVYLHNVTISYSRPHGHVAAVLGTLLNLRLDLLLGTDPKPRRRRVVALIVACVLNPKARTAWDLIQAVSGNFDSLAGELGLRAVDEDEFYAAMDWLLTRQESIERQLAENHLQDSAVALYGLTLACAEEQEWYSDWPDDGLDDDDLDSLDSWRDEWRIKFGLVCDPAGRPVAVDFFEGNATARAMDQRASELQRRFGLKRAALAGTRAKLTEARIREEMALDAEDAARVHQELVQVARAFGRLEVEGLEEWTEAGRGDERARAYVLLRMLAYYVEWHMRERLKPMLHDGEKPPTRTIWGDCVLNFRNLMDELKRICKNRYEVRVPGARAYESVTEPNDLQREAFELLDVPLDPTPRPARRPPIFRE